MLKHKLLVALYCIGSVYNIAVHAETRTDYAVDIIIFEDSEGRYLNSEQWAGELDADKTNAADASDTKEATSGSLTRNLDKLLQPEIRDIDPGKHDLLNAADKRLSNSSRYHILARKSWLQPGLDRDHAVDIKIDSPEPAAGSAPTGSINGTVKIVLERYLHLYTDLVYHKPGSMIHTGISITPASNSVPAVSPTEDFVIKEHRRMRSKELHYIDHPLVGILIKIVPVETNIKTSR